MTYVAKLFPFSNPDALKQTFRGIYMKHENHPILLSPGQCCIYNTGSVTGAGEHWIFLYFTINKSLFVLQYDKETFFKRIGNLQIQGFSKHSINYLFPSFTYQQPHSQICGAYALYFLQHFGRSPDLPRTSIVEIENRLNLKTLRE